MFKRDRRCVGVCECVCVWERERQTDRQTETERKAERDLERKKRKDIKRIYDIQIKWVGEGKFERVKRKY